MNDVWESDETRDYLGAGVYVAYDGYSVLLRINDHRNASSQIGLEPEVLERLIRFAERMKERKQ